MNVVLLIEMLLHCDFNLLMRDLETWNIFVFEHKQNQCNASTGSTTLHAKLTSSLVINFMRQLYESLNNVFFPPFK